MHRILINAVSVYEKYSEEGLCILCINRTANYVVIVAIVIAICYEYYLFLCCVYAVFNINT
jgi:hypothetical protein